MGRNRAHDECAKASVNRRKFIWERNGRNVRTVLKVLSHSSYLKVDQRFILERNLTNTMSVANPSLYFEACLTIR